MDVLEQFLGGGKTTTPSAPSSSSVITDEILDQLKKVESGGDRFALNKESKAMGAYQFMPEQVQTMHKQGIEFNPFNEKESRAAAKSYLEKLVREKGSVEKALATYGGFITKDPTAYVNKVLQAPTAPQTKAPQAQAPQAVSSDPLEAFFSGKSPQSALMQESEAGGGRGSYAGFNAEQKGIAEGQSTRGPRQPEGTAVGRAAGRLLSQVQEGKRALGEIITAPIAGAVTSVLGPATGIVATLRSGQYGTPEGVRIGQEQAQNLQQQLSPEIRTPQAQAVLGGLQKAFEATKVPPVAMPELAGFAPLAAPATRQALETTGKATQAVVKPVREAMGELQIQRPGATAAEAQAQFQAMQAKPGSVGAAKVEFNPYAGQITGEEGARGQFPQVKLSKTAENVPVTEQSTRAQIANEILGDSGQVRPGVVTGNENLLRNEHTKAKMANPTPEGELYKRQIANEQVALSNYAQKRVENTGASPTLVTPYERGQRINDAFAGDEGLAGFFKGEKSKLYKDVTDKVGDNPIQTSNVENLFADKQFKAGLGLKGNEGVARAAEELINLAKTVGFKDEMGNVYAPNSVNGWVAVQKSLNSNWTKDNAGIIRQINQAIEKDIGSAGGLELLKKADSLHQAEKTLKALSKSLATLIPMAFKLPQHLMLFRRS